MKMIVFARYIGKTFTDVRDEIEKTLPKGCTLSVLTDTFPRNIDVNHSRVNFHIDEDFVIRKVSLG